MSIRNYIKKNRRQSSIAYSTICSGATSLNTPQLAAGSFIRSQLAYLENMQEPRAWGAESPSSLPGKQNPRSGF